jgi:hypothetical protein
LCLRNRVAHIQPFGLYAGCGQAAFGVAQAGFAGLKLAPLSLLPAACACVQRSNVGFAYLCIIDEAFAQECAEEVVIPVPAPFVVERRRPSAWSNSSVASARVKRKSAARSSLSCPRPQAGQRKFWFAACGNHQVKLGRLMLKEQTQRLIDQCCIYPVIVVEDQIGACFGLRMASPYTRTPSHALTRPRTPA